MLKEGQRRSVLSPVCKDESNPAKSVGRLRLHLVAVMVRRPAVATGVDDLSDGVEDDVGGPGLDVVTVFRSSYHLLYLEGEGQRCLGVSFAQ